jgi:hypothetical protein
VIPTNLAVVSAQLTVDLSRSHPPTHVGLTAREDRVVSTPDPQSALTRALVETERHVADAGWDQPTRLFSLVKTKALLTREPGLRAQLDPATVRMAEADPDHLIAIEQEDLPPTSQLESLLAGLAWGPDVDGVALTVERIVVPPEAEQQLPTDPDQALDYLAQHPDRADVRLAVAVLRDGPQQCGVRQRQAPEPGQLSVGPELVPGLVAALRSTLATTS